jgi:pyruvate formate lyase activating enzyme
MKEAIYYKKLKENLVRCQLCPHFCTLKENQFGKCKVRQNIKGKLISQNYERLISANPDFIQKKPFYHFLPGTLSYSIATVGCNLSCEHCQNFEISQANIFDFNVPLTTPEEVVKNAIATNCKSISYTYTEPSIMYEFMLDTCKIARKNSLKNNIVSNGYINPGPLKELCKYIDAANIDLKAFNEKFYKEICSAKLKPVLYSLKILKENDIHLEITNLIIPTKNDNLQEIESMCKWIKDNLSKDVPLHFSRFFPYYKMLNLSPTSIKTLEKAKEIAKKYLNYVYIGNIQSENASNTFCPKCNKLIIKRTQLDLIENKLKQGRCFNCNEKIYGIW